MTRLVLTRHGQSQWNLENRFTGWVDVDLTDRGIAQARRGGELLKEAGFKPGFACASRLKRAIRTLWIALEGVDRVWIPVEKTWLLNERHYGALTGLSKAETVAKHGQKLVNIWRRSYNTPPPALAPDDERHPRFDDRYADLDPTQLPGAESLALTLNRVKRYFNAALAPRLHAGENILVSAHGNSLRALVKMLFNLSEQEIVRIEIPTANPLMIELDGLKPVSVRYLDGARARPVPPIKQAA